MSSAKDRPLNLPRLAVALLISTGVAVFLALQSFAVISVRNDPEQSIEAGARMGLALERMASRKFKNQATDPSKAQEAARLARDTALMSFRHEPLVPKSWAIIAMSEEDSTRRKAILEAALKLNRREATLQTAAMSQAVEDGNLAETMAAMDALLRVKPRRSQELFPLMLRAMEQPGAGSEFLSILDLSAPWQESFLRLAVGSEAARVTLAGMHEELGYADNSFNRRLINGLAKQGEIDLAREIYMRVSSASRVKAEDNAVGAWLDLFPPFDWELVSSPSIRAIPTSSYEILEVYLRAGNGGAIASRTLDAKGSKRSVSLTIRSERRLRAGNLRFEAKCSFGRPAYFSVDLTEGVNRFSFESDQADCENPVIELRARAFRGDYDLRAELEEIAILSL